MGALVGLQDSLQAEALMALRTLKGPFSTVYSKVLAELALMGEGSATLSAGEWPFSAVSQLVGSQPALQLEAQLTHCALKRLVLRVPPLVSPQLYLLAQVPSTLGIPAEDSVVFWEFAMLSETLTTLSTGQCSVPTMHVSADIQASQAEELVAFWTSKGFFSCVCPAEAAQLRP